MKLLSGLILLAILVTFLSESLLAQDTSLPPDPGEAGKATVAGVDVDEDGVRDDIQRYIALNYQESARLRSALTQHAKAMHQAVLWETSKAKPTETILSDLLKSLDCLSHIAADPYETYEHMARLRAAILDTHQRSVSYARFNVHIGGRTIDQTPRDKRAENCEVDPDEPEN